MSSAVYYKWLSITRTLPSLGPSFFSFWTCLWYKWDHRASVALCPTTPPKTAQALHSSHAGLPAVLSMHAKCVPTSGFLHGWFPLPEMLFPSYLACWLSHIKMSTYWHCSSLPPFPFPLTCLKFIHHICASPDILQLCFLTCSRCPMNMWRMN